MASGSYARKPTPRDTVQSQPLIPQRATRQLLELPVDEEEPEESSFHPSVDKAINFVRSVGNPITGPLHFIITPRVVDQFAPHPLEQHRQWIRSLIICLVVGIIFAGVLLSASMLQRPGSPQFVSFFGSRDSGVYSIQVGGTLASKWQSNTPVSLSTRVAASAASGPYSVMGPPTITADFINRVLAANNSPAAGKGQMLYDLGVKYGIDPVYALAFFQHESSFGKTGEANASLSLGNLRCIPNFPCRDNFAWFPSWEAGFEAFYKLLRNLYVGIWHLTTIDQIIPVYAPSSDHNDVAAYIASLKHAVDTWRSGQLND